MPNPWTGKGNPYTRKEVNDRLRATLKKGEPIIAAGAGTGISAKFIEKGGADLIIIYNSGRFRMAGRGSTAGLMAYGDANAIAMEIGEYEVLPVVEEIPVICGVHATDPRRRMWHWLGKVKEDRKSTRLNSSHSQISYAVFCLKKKKKNINTKSKHHNTIQTESLLILSPTHKHILHFNMCN